MQRHSRRGFKRRKMQASESRCWLHNPKSRSFLLFRYEWRKISQCMCCRRGSLFTDSQEMLEFSDLSRSCAVPHKASAEKPLRLLLCLHNDYEIFFSAESEIALIAVSFSALSETFSGVVRDETCGKSLIGRFSLSLELAARKKITNQVCDALSRGHIMFLPLSRHFLTSRSRCDKRRAEPRGECYARALSMTKPASDVQRPYWK